MAQEATIKNKIKTKNNLSLPLSYSQILSPSCLPAPILSHAKTQTYAYLTLAVNRPALTFCLAVHAPVRSVLPAGRHGEQRQVHHAQRPARELHHRARRVGRAGHERTARLLPAHPPRYTGFLKGILSKGSSRALLIGNGIKGKDLQLAVF